MGGGKDLDPAFRWLCERAHGGDFLILGATADDEYNQYVNKLCHLNSVATLVLPNREAAEDPFSAETIRGAEAIFITGGDQSNYVKYWQGTPVQTAINERLSDGVPIGGTSAGVAVPGEFVFTAMNDTAYSKETLADPYNKGGSHWARLSTSSVHGGDSHGRALREARSAGEIGRIHGAHFAGWHGNVGA